MTWTWRYETPSGELLSEPAAETFPTQSDAESWLGESWRQLLEGGVGQVSLLEDGRVEYTMPLTPAG